VVQTRGKWIATEERLVVVWKKRWSPRSLGEIGGRQIKMKFFCEEKQKVEGGLP